MRKQSAAELETGFADLLRETVQAFEAERLPYMLVGGLAVGAWTEPRATKDVDFAVQISPAEASRLETRLSAAGLSSFRGDLATAADGGVVRLRVERDETVVDLLCAGTEFEREALSRCRPASVLGVSLQLVDPDDLLLFKLIARRPQDIADADALIRHLELPRDAARFERWVDEWEVRDVYARLVAH